MQIDVNGTVVELSEKQLELYHALTELQQNVVMCKLMGMTNRNAYLAGGGQTTNDHSTDAAVARLLGMVKVREFMQSVQNTKFATQIMTRDEMASMLSNLARTNLDDILTYHTGDEEFQNVETGEMTTGQTHWTLKPINEMKNAGHAAISELSVGKDGMKIKTHSKLAAAKQLSDMLGYNKPQQLEVNVGFGLGDLYDDFEAEE